MIKIKHKIRRVAMRITMEMVNELNKILAKDGCIFKMKFVDRHETEPDHKLLNPEMKIVPANNKYIWNISGLRISANPEFYEFLESFFQDKGIELEYNDTGSRIWSKYGLEDLLGEIDSNADENEQSSATGMELS